MTEMIERMARAYDPIGWAWYDHATSDHPAKPIFFADKIGRMCAAIEAMREPTFDPETVSYHEGMTRTDWWRAMIDEALGRKP